MTNIIRKKSEQTLQTAETPVVNTLQELQLITSPAQIERLMLQNQVVGTLSIKISAQLKEKAKLTLKLHQSQEYQKLQELKKELKRNTEALNSATERLNGSYQTLLADFMPGKSIPEKIQAIEQASSHKQLEA